MRGQGPPQIKMSRSSSTKIIGFFCSSRAALVKKHLERFSLSKKSRRDFFDKLKREDTVPYPRVFLSYFSSSSQSSPPMASYSAS